MPVQLGRVGPQDGELELVQVVAQSLPPVTVRSPPVVVGVVGDTRCTRTLSIATWAKCSHGDATRAKAPAWAVLKTKPAQP